MVNNATQTEKRVKKVIADALNAKMETIRLEANFTEALGAHPLDIFEIQMGLEEEFDCTIPDEDAVKIKTVKQAIDYMSSHIKKMQQLEHDDEQCDTNRK